MKVENITNIENVLVMYDWKAVQRLLETLKENEYCLHVLLEWVLWLVP